MKITTRYAKSDPDAGLQTIYFEYINPAAHAVAIAGTFNDWRPQVTPMIKMSDGRWRKILVVAPGTYEYTFVVDGHWVDQFTSKESSHATRPWPRARQSEPGLSGRLGRQLETPAGCRPGRSG